MGTKVFGQKSFFQSFYQLRLLTGLLASAPLLAICLWYGAGATAAHYRYNLAVGKDRPLTLELFQLHLNDLLRRDLRRLSMEDAEKKSPLPILGVVMSTAELDLINGAVPPTKDKAPYAKGYLVHEGELYQAQVRYRGGKHWHWMNPQRSMKFKLAKDLYIRGNEVFALKNEPDPMSFGEQIIMDLAREWGLLTPEYGPVRVLLNKAYQGVFFLSGQPDEGLLRNSRRYPAKIYSGNDAPKDPETGVCNLWDSTEAWKLVARKSDDALDDLSEMKALQAALKKDQLRFAAFAQDHLDLEKFATFDALDVIFGGNQHDYKQDQKLYFDPYKGRFEPIAWNFRGFRHEDELNRVENPLLLGLKTVPGYISLRNKLVLKLLNDQVSEEGLQARATTIMKLTAKDLARDPYWDAYRQLPPVDNYLEQLPRPMSEARQALTVASTLAVQGQRNRFIQRLLTAEPLTSKAWMTAPGAALVQLSVTGESGVLLRKVEALGAGTCEEPVTIGADRNGDLALDEAEATDALDIRAGAFLGLELHPGIQLVARKKPSAERGAVYSVPAPNPYPFVLRLGNCPVKALKLSYENLVTGAIASRELPLAPSPQPDAAGAGFSCGSAEFPRVAGTHSLHPWCHPKAKSETLVLGPGEVVIDSRRVFRQPVEVRAGTTFLMKQGGELVFRARVDFKGKRKAPIELKASDGCWGGLVIQGPESSGSRLRWVKASGACGPREGLTSFPAVFNFHDTRDLRLRDVDFGGFGGTRDALHLAYVEGFDIRDLTVTGAPEDALDIEFGSGSIDGFVCAGAGDECLDTMGTDLTVNEALLIRAGGNGLSAGEESQVALRNTVVARSKVGFLVKNGSKVTSRDCLLYRNRSGVRLEFDSTRYTAKAAFEAPDLWILGEGKEYQEKGKTLLKVSKTHRGLERGDLPALRDLLGISDWKGLDARLKNLVKEEDAVEDSL
jgi:hypothetical protein